MYFVEFESVDRFGLRYQKYSISCWNSKHVSKGNRSRALSFQFLFDHVNQLTGFQWLIFWSSLQPSWLRYLQIYTVPEKLSSDMAGCFRTFLMYLHSSTSYLSLRFQKVEQLREVPTNGTKPQTLESFLSLLQKMCTKRTRSISHPLPAFLIPRFLLILRSLCLFQFKEQGSSFIRNLYDLLLKILTLPEKCCPFIL